MALSSFIYKNYFPPESFYEWVLSILIFFTFVSLCSSWSFLFRALKLKDVPRMPLNNQILDLFNNERNNEKHILYSLTIAYKKVLDENKIVNLNKVNLLNKAYEDTVFSGFFILADIFFIVLIKSGLTKYLN